MRHKALLDARTPIFWWMENRAVDDGWIAYLGTYAWAVYCTLVRHADASGQTMPSVQAVSDITGVSLSEVKRSYKALLRSGLISRRKRGGPTTTTVYQINQIPVHKNTTVRSRKAARPATIKLTPQPRPGASDVTRALLAQLDGALDEFNQQMEGIAAIAEAGSTRKRQPRKRCPPDWSPEPAHLRIAEERGVNYKEELAKFRDHEFATGKTDWNATFRNWLRNARPTTPSRVTDARKDVADFYEREEVV